MANTIFSNGSTTFQVNGLNVVGDMTLTYELVGNNIVANVQNVALSSWQGLSTSSLADIKFIYVQNVVDSGSVRIATDASGTNIISRLAPGDFTFIPWSGSAALYAQSYDSASVITTIIVES